MMRKACRNGATWNRSTSRMRSVLMTTALCAPLTLSAQTLPPPAEKIYRLVKADGGVVYADRAMPDTRIERTIEVPVYPKNTPRPIEVDGARLPSLPDLNSAGGAPAAGAPASTPATESEAASAAVLDAERALAAARRRRDEGMTPLPGERSGIAGGGSRLNERYLERQRQLEAEVAQRETALEKAYAARRALR